MVYWGQDFGICFSLVVLGDIQPTKGWCAVCSGYLSAAFGNLKVEYDRLLYVVWNFLFHLMRNLLFYIDICKKGLPVDGESFMEDSNL